MSKYLDSNGLLYFKNKLDGLFATQAVVSTKIADPSSKSANQVLTYNGTNWVASNPASPAGSVNGIVKGDGAGNVSAAVAGTDYQIPLTPGVDYQVPVAFDGTYDATTNKAATVATVTEAISHITTFSFHICVTGEYDPETRIPTIVSPSTSTIYLVPMATAGSHNAYVEWAYISNQWESLGQTEISIESITNSEIDDLFD